MWHLFQFPLCPFSRKVRLLLSEKGIPFELERENPWEGRDEFYALNPAGRTPVLHDPERKATLVDIKGGPDSTLVSLLIGNERSASQLNARQYYVRKSGEAGALLVEGELNVSAEPQDWVDPDVVNVATERVRKVTITPADGSAIVVSKEKPTDNFFSLENVPTGFTAKARSVISSLGAVLLDVKFENVAAASKVAARWPGSPTAAAAVRSRPS